MWRTVLDTADETSPAEPAGEEVAAKARIAVTGRSIRILRSPAAADHPAHPKRAVSE